VLHAESTSLSLSLLFQPEYIANPYPLYHQLRSTQPVYWDAGIDNWVLTRYDHVIAALQDPRLTSERVILDPEEFPEEIRKRVQPPLQALMKQMIFLDPPHHTRLRRLVARAFTPRMVEHMRPHIQQCVDHLLDKVQEQGRLEIIGDLAYPLPGLVIVEMLGIPLADQQQFIQWTDDYGSLLDGKIRTYKELLRVLQSVSNLMDYFRNTIAQRRTTPRSDLMQALITAEEHGDVLSETELLANCVLLLVTGHGTTTHLIGNGMLELLQHPDQLQQVRKNLALIERVVQETLRHESPVQAAARLAKEDLELGGQEIKAGQGVFMCLGAANRDPVYFSEPDLFDIHRSFNRHIAFGHGIHVCLGAALARIQGQIALQTLLQRFPILQLETQELEWERGLSVRGLKSLSISIK
jgi:cytochrome P450